MGLLLDDFHCVSFVFGVELVVDGHRKLVPLFDHELRHVEKWRKHGRLQTGAAAHCFQRVQRAAQLLLVENLFYNILNDWGSRGVADELNEMNLVRVQARECDRVGQHLVEAACLGVAQFLKLVAFEVSDEVLLLHEVFEVHGGVGHATEEDTGLFNAFEHAQSGPVVLARVAAMFLEELFSKFLHDGVVEVTRAEVALRVVTDDLALRFDELCDCAGRLRVTEVHEGDDAGSLFIKVALSEEPVIEADGGAFVNYSQSFEACNFCRIKKCLSLDVRGIRGNAQDDVLSDDTGIFVKVPQA